MASREIKVQAVRQRASNSGAREDDDLADYRHARTVYGHAVFLLGGGRPLLLVVVLYASPGLTAPITADSS